MGVVVGVGVLFVFVLIVYIVSKERICIVVDIVVGRVMIDRLLFL